MPYRDKKGRVALTPKVLAALRLKATFTHVIKKLQRSIKGGKHGSFQFPGRMIVPSKMHQWIKTVEEMSGHAIQR